MTDVEPAQFKCQKCSFAWSAYSEKCSTCDTLVIKPSGYKSVVILPILHNNGEGCGCDDCRKIIGKLVQCKAHKFYRTLEGAFTGCLKCDHAYVDWVNWLPH